MKKTVFPQANNLELIYKILFDIGPEGVTKENISNKYNMDERQGAYYLDALVYIGVVEKINVKYFLNEKGVFVRLQASDECKKSFCSFIIEHPFLGDLYKNTMNMNSDEKLVYISSRITNVYDLNLNTSNRRASSIVSWFNYINNVMDGDNND